MKAEEERNWLDIENVKIKQEKEKMFIDLT